MPAFKIHSFCLVPQIQICQFLLYLLHLTNKWDYVCLLIVDDVFTAGHVWTLNTNFALLKNCLRYCHEIVHNIACDNKTRIIFEHCNSCNQFIATTIPHNFGKHYIKPSRQTNILFKQIIANIGFFALLIGHQYFENISF